MIAGRELRYREGGSDSLPCGPRALGVRVAEGDLGRGRRQRPPDAGPMQETASGSQADASAGLHNERR